MSILGLVDSESKEGMPITPLVVTSDYIMSKTDSLITIDASSNPVTVTLPALPVVGRDYGISVVNSDFNIEVDLNGNNFYDDSDNQVLFIGDKVEFTFDGVRYT